MDFPVTREIRTDLGTREGADILVEQLPREIEALFLCHGIANNTERTNGLQVQLTNYYSFQYLTECLLPRIGDNGSVTMISSDAGKGWRRSIQACEKLIACKTWDQALAWYEAHPDLTRMGYPFSKECQFVYVMSQCHAPAFIDRKIRLNAIGPGMTKTGLTDDFNRSVGGNDAAKGQARLESMILAPWHGRWATAEEMGYPLVAIGSRLFSYMSGQIIQIDYGAASAWEMNELREQK
jgi:NAD(P)-dependent dehydrogenase (short-subunit alcohol dehydrogenase family)